MLAWSGRVDPNFRTDQQLECPQDLGLAGRWALLTTAQEKGSQCEPEVTATGGLEKVWYHGGHLIRPIQEATSADPSEAGQEEA